MDGNQGAVKPTINLKQAIKAINTPVDNIEVRVAEQQLIKQVGKRKYHQTMNNLLTDDMRRKQERLLKYAKKHEMINLG